MILAAHGNIIASIGKRVRMCPSVPIMCSRILRSRITSPALTQTVDYNHITCSLPLGFQIPYQKVVLLLTCDPEIHHVLLITNTCGPWPSGLHLYDVAAAWFRTCTRPGQRPHPKMPDRRLLVTPGHLQRRTTGVATWSG